MRDARLQCVLSNLCIVVGTCNLNVVRMAVVLRDGMPGGSIHEGKRSSDVYTRRLFAWENCTCIVMTDLESALQSLYRLSRVSSLVCVLPSTLKSAVKCSVILTFRWRRIRWGGAGCLFTTFLLCS